MERHGEEDIFWWDPDDRAAQAWMLRYPASEMPALLMEEYAEEHALICSWSSYVWDGSAYGEAGSWEESLETPWDVGSRMVAAEVLGAGVPESSEPVPVAVVAAAISGNGDALAELAAAARPARRARGLREHDASTFAVRLADGGICALEARWERAPYGGGLARASLVRAGGEPEHVTFGLADSEVSGCPSPYTLAWGALRAFGEDQSRQSPKLVRTTGLHHSRLAYGDAAAMDMAKEMMDAWLPERFKGRDIWALDLRAAELALQGPTAEVRDVPELGVLYVDRCGDLLSCELLVPKPADGAAPLSTADADFALVPAGTRPALARAIPQSPRHVSDSRRMGTAPGRLAAAASGSPLGARLSDLLLADGLAASLGHESNLDLPHVASRDIARARLALGARREYAGPERAAALLRVRRELEGFAAWIVDDPALAGQLAARALGQISRDDALPKLEARELMERAVAGLSRAEAHAALSLPPGRVPWGERPDPSVEIAFRSALERAAAHEPEEPAPGPPRADRARDASDTLGEDGAACWAVRMPDQLFPVMVRLLHLDGEWYGTAFTADLVTGTYEADSLYDGFCFEERPTDAQTFECIFGVGPERAEGMLASRDVVRVAEETFDAAVYDRDLGVLGDLWGAFSADGHEARDSAAMLAMTPEERAAARGAR